MNQATLKKIGREIIEKISALIERLKQEPVLVRTFLVLLASAGLIEISDTQIDKAEAIALAGLLLLGGASTRRKVTPTRSLEQAETLDRRSEVGGQE